MPSSLLMQRRLDAVFIVGFHIRRYCCGRLDVFIVGFYIRRCCGCGCGRLLTPSLSVSSSSVHRPYNTIRLL
jgi:hypothetical protein